MLEKIITALTTIRNKSNSKNSQDENSQSDGSSGKKKINQNWSQDRYDSLLTQRNFAFIIAVSSMISVGVACVSIWGVSVYKTFDPFVVQVDQNTGSAKIVTPANSDLLTANDALTKYFIKRYLIARETYNPVDYDKNIRKVLRLYSAPDVYRDFMGFLRHNNQINDPSVKYAQKNTTFITIKSWSKLEKNKYMIRFSVSETAGSMTVFNKISVVDVRYVAMELSEDDRDINPVGFQVNGYRVDDDNS
jgi:type IV secretion system protein VirB8